MLIGTLTVFVPGVTTTLPACAKMSFSPRVVVSVVPSVVSSVVPSVVDSDVSSPASVIVAGTTITLRVLTIVSSLETVFNVPTEAPIVASPEPITS